MRGAARNSAKQHAEWLSLVEVSGPFLTLNVLNQSLTVGLDAHEADIYRSVKEAYEEWEESDSRSIHNAWIRFLLTSVLGYPDELIVESQSIPQAATAELELVGQRIRPDLAILDPDRDQRVLIPILTYPRTQKLDSPITGESWAASPHTRMQLLLQNIGLQAGFVTNGAQWSLVHVRKGEPTGFAIWQTILLTEEKVLLQAFIGILGAGRTIGAPADQTLFALLNSSAEDQEEVTKELGRQVRMAVEVFVNALDRLDQDSGRELLAEESPQTVYNAALMVMMRLIFLLCAEERDLMDSRALYVQHYSVSSLVEQIREDSRGDEQVLEHRHDAWRRLLATFRLVFGGCSHQDLNLPAYGGSLFDPSHYPFLEEASIDNRVTLHLLDALEFLEIRVPGGGRERRRLSFRALGVEQIGHVYEGLLDHTAKRAGEPVVSLRGKEAEHVTLSVAVLEEHIGDLPELFEQAKIKTAGNVRRLLESPVEPLAESKLRAACGRDDELFRRIRPFLNLIREDSLEHLQIYPVGSLFVVEGTARKSSGTYYTPVTLTEQVVRYALEPQVYVGPAEGLPPTEWKLKSAKEIVDLKVCDMAMGSGAFLVQACRYLSERLVEAWQIVKDTLDRPVGFSPEGHYFTHQLSTDRNTAGGRTLIHTPHGNIAVADPSQELISDDPEERLSQARRIIADRCLYGVDINPMAVEMAKLSLWLTTMRRDRPFSFLDHALRLGDSLLGVTDRQLEAFNMNPDGQYGGLLLPWVGEAVGVTRRYRDQLARIPSHDPLSIERKQHLLDESQIAIQRVRSAGDLLLSETLTGRSGTWDDKALERLEQTLDMLTPSAPGAYMESMTLHSLGVRTEGVRAFHWQIEFPDVFASGGFDAIVGNPPFLGGQKITGALGTEYRDFLVSHIAGGKRGSADLCAYFFLRAATLLKSGGTFGLLATNTISQGDTREVGLDQIVSQANVIYRAEKSSKWPGKANLEIAKVWVHRGAWEGVAVLEGDSVQRITPFLDDGSASGKPHRLKANEGLSFQGSIVLGMGFVLDPEEARELIDRDVRNKDVLFPYLNGEDLNSRSDQSPSRWVISFFDWPLGRVGQRLPHSDETVVAVIRASDLKRFEEIPCDETSRWCPDAAEPIPRALAHQREKWLRLGLVPRDYPGPVAADYPDCLELVEKLVRPERAKLASGDVTARDRAARWWRFGRRSGALYQALEPLDRCLVRARVSQYHSFSWIPKGIIASEATVVIASDRDAVFAVVQSSFHQAFTELNASSMRTDTRYTPSDCFEPFPLPILSAAIDKAGAAFEESRRNACIALGEGLTDVAKRMHDPNCELACIRSLQQRFVAMDFAVRDAYEWLDISLEHGHYGNGRDRRFTISPAARQELLRRLLRLNHERYTAEVAAGLHDKGKSPKAVKHRGMVVAEPRASYDQFGGPRGNLFDEQPTLGEAMT